MNLDFSEDELALKAEARRFLEARCTSSTTRAVLDDDAISFDRELWRSLVEMGWVGARIPEKWGGSGLGHVELCAIAEEMGRVIAPVPFSSTAYIFAEAIINHGSDAQRERLLPEIAQGRAIGCLATSEGPGAAGMEAIQTEVVGGRLSGTKAPVTDGDIATHAIVSAREGNASGLYVVALSGDGLRRETLRSIDPTRSVARLSFDEAVCEPLGKSGDGAALLSGILDRAAIFLAFEQVGGADKCLDTARGYALARYAFGKPIGANQAIKHKLADIYVKNQLARSHAYFGAWAFAEGGTELAKAAAAARIAGTQAYDFAAKENLQTHGGMGFTWEADCHLHLRRSRQLALSIGGLPAWRERLVRSLESQVLGLGNSDGLY
ncbi:MAG TPA: acyl-CoA dehydrogenase family protein [Sphingobium sp.]